MAGQTQQHDYGDSTSGPLFDLGITRALTPRSRLSFRVGTNLVDTLDAFKLNAQFDANVQDTNDAVVSRDTYQFDYMSLGLDVSAERNSFNVAVDWRQEDHELDASLNRETLGVNAGFNRRLRPTLSLGIDGFWQTEEFSDAGGESDEWSIGLGVDWGFARGFSLGLRGERFEGSGDAVGGFGGRDYEENRVSLTLSYRPGR
jgi:uncharacterized protein (PEP-CTERM system associated)